MPIRVVIGLCTCRRPEQLRRALEAIAGQYFDGEIQVAVVDNDVQQEGSRVCLEIARDYPFALEHAYEAKPGLCHARNALLGLALSGPCDFIAMLDDDEWPDPDWLNRLMCAQARTDADIVGGITEPVFEVAPKPWIERGEYFRRTGASYSTGNLLLRMDMLRAQDRWFDTRLNFVGNEDREFVDRLRAQGYRATVSDDAVVREWVPDRRARLGFLLARGVREGNADMYLAEISGAGISRRMGLCGMKLLFALNHLFWAPLQTWRFFRCLDDLAAFCGMALGLMHYRYQFYAATRRQTPDAARDRRPDRTA